ncbi:MAG: hypothetical protein LBB89_00295 [Treponema sp.]|jgi:hypothetical protein|nr:hypothetical protein [Treponema sp.]
MDIGSVTSYHAFPTIEYAITASQGIGSQNGKASLPVAPSAAIYAHFKHISGVPAPDGVQGVNINKLKIIDALIEQISKMKKQPDISDVQPLTDMSGQSDEKRINALIDKFQNQVRQAVNTNSPYTPAAPLTGAIFNISV